MNTVLIHKLEVFVSTLYSLKKNIFSIGFFCIKILIFFFKNFRFHRLMAPNRGCFDTLPRHVLPLVVIFDLQQKFKQPKCSYNLILLL